MTIANQIIEKQRKHYQTTSWFISLNEKKLQQFLFLKAGSQPGSEPVESTGLNQDESASAGKLWHSLTRAVESTALSKPMMSRFYPCNVTSTSARTSINIKHMHMQSPRPGQACSWYIKLNQTNRGAISFTTRARISNDLTHWSSSNLILFSLPIRDSFPSPLNRSTASIPAHIQSVIPILPNWVTVWGQFLALFIT